MQVGAGLAGLALIAFLASFWIKELIDGPRPAPRLPRRRDPLPEKLLAMINLDTHRHVPAPRGVQRGGARR